MNGPEQAPNTLETTPDGYIESETVIEAAGHRFTLFVQILPGLMTDKAKNNPEELDRLRKLLQVWHAFDNFAKQGRFVL